MRVAAERTRGAFHSFGGATKNIKIIIRRCLRLLQNSMKNATINQKPAALTDGRWSETRERVLSISHNPCRWTWGTAPPWLRSILIGL